MVFGLQRRELTVAEFGKKYTELEEQSDQLRRSAIVLQSRPGFFRSILGELDAGEYLLVRGKIIDLADKYPTQHEAFIEAERARHVEDRPEGA